MLSAILAVLAPLAPVPFERTDARPGFARRAGLSLTVTLDRKAYAAGDDVTLRFALKNESGRVMFVADSWMAPKHHEAGPGRHLEVHVKAGGTAPLYFWSGVMSECRTSSKAFRLLPGETYRGTILLSAGPRAIKALGVRSGDVRGGSFEDRASRKAHVLGKDGRKYTVELRYQVRPDSHGILERPPGFKDGLLWMGELTTGPLAFEVNGE